MPQRAQSTTPRRARGGFRTQTFQDPWVPSDEEDSKDERLSRSTGRLPPRRRNTDFNPSTLRSAFTPSPPPSPTLGVGLREQETTIDKLKKENWDLKHRIALQQERSKKLEADLESALDKLRQSDSLFQKNASLEKENGRLKMKLTAVQDENVNLNAELEQWHEEFVLELEQKDHEIRDRHLAIEEAAGWIQRLEIENQTLKQSIQPQQTTGQPDSDYFSGDQESVPSTSDKATKPSPLTPAADSDYFSADTSPNLTPKTPRQRPIITTEEDARKSNARLSALSFNRELGLRSITSKDSLFGNFLDSIAPEQTSSRTLRRRCSRNNLTPPQEVRTPSSSGGPAPAWSTSRPLRDLYKAGDLGRRVDKPDHAIPPRPLSPSTASIMTRSATNDTDADADSDIFSRGGTTRPSSPTATINDALFDINNSTVPDSPSAHRRPANKPRSHGGPGLQLRPLAAQDAGLAAQRQPHAARCPGPFPRRRHEPDVRA